MTTPRVHGALPGIKQTDYSPAPRAPQVPDKPEHISTVLERVLHIIEREKEISDLVIGNGAATVTQDDMK
jgi:hypothetical protein